MATRDILTDWVVDALRARGGSGNVVSVAKYIWENHEEDLRQSGELFYTWQYDMRWAATKLRDRGVIKPADESRSLPWELVEPAPKR